MPAAVAVVGIAAAGTGVATAVGATVLGAFGVAAASSAITTLAAGVIGGAIIGAVTGGISAAITGGDILDGALKGGLIGGISGGIGAWGQASNIASATGGWMETINYAAGGADVAGLAAAEASVNAASVATGAAGAEGSAAITANLAMDSGVNVADNSFLSANSYTKYAGADATPVPDGLLSSEAVQGAAGEIAKEGTLMGAAKDASKGLLDSFKLNFEGSDLVTMAGNMLDTSEQDRLEMEERLSNQAYERSKSKLQTGVDVTPQVGILDEEAYAKSGTSPTGSRTASAPVATPTFNPNAVAVKNQQQGPLKTTENLINK